MEINTLIVDDEPDIRQLIAMAIEAANQGLSVCGEAGDGTTALDLAEAVDPEVVVLDERMPGMTGLETATELLRRRPGQAIVMCSAYLDVALRKAAEKVGIRMCLAKNEVHRIPEVLWSVTAEG